MAPSFSAIKSFVFTAHILLMMSGLGAVAVHVYGLENAKSNTIEHTYYIVAIILSMFVSLVTIFGCYGALAETIGVNILYAILLMIWFFLQVQQMHAFKPVIFQRDAELYMNRSWHMVTLQPHYMQSLENSYRCCGLSGHEDYKELNMTAPFYCYQNINNQTIPTRGCFEALKFSYQNATHREILSNWCLLAVEIISYLLAVIHCFLIFKRPRQHQPLYAPVHLRNVPRLNHVNSRTQLLSS